VVIWLFIITLGIGTRHAVGSSKTHFLLLHFAADECLRLRPRPGLLFSAAYG
jgi:hypothetical protein